jgi:crotonobetainyl-CoA:carnitine CoA-transferase CaiB-like acyl-CoA transferase
VAALHGIKILEVANYITGPYAAMLLADLGAEVIKIEIPGTGDPFRGWGGNGYTPTFCSINRNKQSLSLNVQEPAGKDVFRRLAQNADVVIENLRPGVLEELGLGYDAIAAQNPRIIYCSISGYGGDGPYRDRPGYDTIGQAMSGLLGVLTDMEAPRPVGSSLSDLLTGMFACYAVQGALFSRERTGRGQKVETSLLQASIAFGAENAVRYLATDVIPKRTTRVHLAQVYCGVSSDGLPLAIHLSSPPKFWQALADVMGRPELKTDPRFAKIEGRIANYDVLDPIIRDWCRRKPREELLALLTRSDVPAAPILDMKEVFEDPQIKHLGMVVEMTHPKMGKVRLVDSPIRMSATPPQMRMAPPTIGEHTQHVLQELGYDERAIDELKAAGAI